MSVLGAGCLGCFLSVSFVVCMSLSPSSFDAADTPRPQDLAQRRQQLKAQRKVRFYTMAWRAFAITGLACGSVWLATSPIWLIRSAQQVEVSDNQLLSDENIQGLLPVPYPQSLLKVQPGQLKASLTAYPPVEDAVVSRRLLPPGLHVKLTERVPVAIALPDTAFPVSAIPDQPIPFREPGLLDAQGYWMPRNSYSVLGAEAVPPKLTVIGMRPGYESAWQTIYREVSKSPVAITAIDWKDLNNLVLQTELGSVHLGPYGSSFATQLGALDQLRALEQEVNPETVVFIDLRDPNNPVVETLQATNPPEGVP